MQKDQLIHFKITPNILLDTFKGKFQVDPQNPNIFKIPWNKGSMLISNQPIPKKGKIQIKVVVHRLNKQHWIEFGLIPQNRVNSSYNSDQGIFYDIGRKYLKLQKQEKYIDDAEKFDKLPSDLIMIIDWNLGKIFWFFNKMKQCQCVIPEWAKKEQKLYAQVQLWAQFGSNADRKVQLC